MQTSYVLRLNEAKTYLHALSPASGDTPLWCVPYEQWWLEPAPGGVWTKKDIVGDGILVHATDRLGAIIKAQRVAREWLHEKPTKQERILLLWSGDERETNKENDDVR